MSKETKKRRKLNPALTGTCDNSCVEVRGVMDPMPAGAVERRDCPVHGERYVLVAGGDGYQTAIVTGRFYMRRAVVLAHFPDADFTRLNLDEYEVLKHVCDPDNWSGDHESYNLRYEADWLFVYRLTDDMVGVMV